MVLALRSNGCSISFLFLTKLNKAKNRSFIALVQEKKDFIFSSFLVLREF